MHNSNSRSDLDMFYTTISPLLIVPVFPVSFVFLKGLRYDSPVGNSPFYAAGTQCVNISEISTSTALASIRAPTFSGPLPMDLQAIGAPTALMSDILLWREDVQYAVHDDTSLDLQRSHLAMRMCGQSLLPHLSVSLCGCYGRLARRIRELLR